MEVYSRQTERQTHICDPEERHTGFVANGELFSYSLCNGKNWCAALPKVGAFISRPSLSQHGYWSSSCMSVAPDFPGRSPKGASIYFPLPGCSCAGEDVTISSTTQLLAHQVPLANMLQLLQSQGARSAKSRFTGNEEGMNIALNLHKQ